MTSDAGESHAGWIGSCDPIDQVDSLISLPRWPIAEATLVSRLACDLLYLRRSPGGARNKHQRVLLSTSDPPVAPIGMSERPRFQCSQCYQVVLDLQLPCFLTSALSLFQQIAVPFDQYVDLVLAGHAASIGFIMRQIRSMLRQSLVFFCECHLRMSRFTVMDCVGLVPRIRCSPQPIGSLHGL